MIRPRTGMVLAAGRGERLRPLTDTLPKPLVEIAGRSLLDHAIDRLEAAGVETVVVNVHHLAERIVEHLARRASPRLVISREPDGALETGGAIVHARALLGDAPFFVVNGDSLWLDGKVPTLERLARAWDPETVDAVLLVQSTVRAVGYDEPYGDCRLDQLGRLAWRREREVVPYLYAGVQLLSPVLFRDLAPGVFRLNRVWDQAIAADRLRAIVHDGEWYHVSSPAGLERVRARLERRRIER